MSFDADGEAEWLLDLNIETHFAFYASREKELETLAAHTRSYEGMDTAQLCSSTRGAIERSKRDSVIYISEDPHLTGFQFEPAQAPSLSVNRADAPFTSPIIRIIGRDAFRTTGDKPDLSGRRLRCEINCTPSGLVMS